MLLRVLKLTVNLLFAKTIVVKELNVPSVHFMKKNLIK